MPNLEWRHPDGTQPAFLLADGRMVGEWYPIPGMLMVYIGRMPKEHKARRVLEAFARIIASDLGSLDEFSVLQKLVDAAAER